MADLKFIVDQYGHEAIAVWTTLKRYSVRSRGQPEEWFVDDINLPAGEFAAGPFSEALDAEMAYAQLLADAAGKQR